MLVHSFNGSHYAFHPILVGLLVGKVVIIMRGFKLNHTLIIKIISSLDLGAHAQKIKLKNVRIVGFRDYQIYCRRRARGGSGRC